MSPDKNFSSVMLDIELQNCVDIWFRHMRKREIIAKSEGWVQLLVKGKHLAGSH